MTTKPKASSRGAVSAANEAQRHSLVLRAWEAINAERELAGVLAAVGEVLAPEVPFGGLALAAFEGEQCWSYAFHIEDLFKEFFAAGKVSAALCHGTCLLLYLANADGTPFVEGRKMTGFANSEEDYADNAVGQKLMPFRIEDEAKKLGAQFSTMPAFKPYAVRDGNLITGQQQHSGLEVARLVIAALEGKA